MSKTYEVFTTKYSKIIQAVTPGLAEDNFWRQEKDQTIEIIAIIEIERGNEFIKGKDYIRELEIICKINNNDAKLS